MKSQPKVLVVDDEPHIRRLIQTALVRAGYTSILAQDASEALSRLTDERPDVVLLDLGLPDRDGLELVPLVKRRSDATLIVVSAREATQEKVAALDLGADDYLVKPFDTEELLARVRSALRNRSARGGGAPTLTINDVTIDTLNHVITKAGQEVHLTPKEYAVLTLLANAPGRVITHKQILTHVWPREIEPHVEYLRVLVRSLRQKLESDPQRPTMIVNELGVGYRLQGTIVRPDGQAS